MTIKEEHILAAIEGYLKSLSMIHDDDTVVSVKRNRDHTYEIEVERE